MNRRHLLVFIGFVLALPGLSAAPSVAGPRRFVEIRRYAVPEARQGVAVDGGYFYAITNTGIAKYRRADGGRVAAWSCPEGQPLIHLNAGLVVAGKLYCAHSNYPGVPSVSSVEIFDPATLRHVGTHSFGEGYGSLTWLDRRGGAWYACFAYYGNRAAEPGHGPAWTQLVEFDDGWRRIGGWVLPAKLVAEKFGHYSCSGGAFGPDGRLYVTGHDATELFVLEFPDGGSTLRWVDTIDIPAEGQAFAWDPQHPWELWTILKRMQQVIVGRVDPPRP